MSMLKTALILAAATGGAATVMWLLFRAVSPRQPRIAPAGPSPDELLRLKGEVAAAEWIVCDSPDCRHLEAPHRREFAEFATCMWCGHVAMVPAPTTPKES